MAEVFLAVGLILLALFILVTIHELGHFGVAKLLKIRVDVFSIFFPPKLFSFKKGDTTYQIGAIPVGGFVKIAGMIDESGDTEFLNQPVQPWEFRSRPVWQRFLVMVAGVVMNVLLSIIIFSSLKLFYGESHLLASNMEEYGILVARGGAHIGLKDGDKILSYNGEKPKYMDEMSSFMVLMESEAYYEIDRKGTKMKIVVPDTLVDSMKCWKKDGAMFGPGLPTLLEVPEEISLNDSSPAFPSPAYQAGLKTGDRLVSLDGTEVVSFTELPDLLEDRGGDTVAVGYLRNGSLNTVDIPLGEKPILGVKSGGWMVDTVSYGFFGAIAAGTKQSFGIVNQQIKGYKALGSGKASVSQNMSGIIGIAQTITSIYKSQGWPGFWAITAFLSMVLAFVNILPIPALDGGHIMFLAWEGITGKEPNDKVKTIAQYVGFGIVILLLVATVGNDIIQIWFSGPDPCA